MVPTQEDLAGIVAELAHANGELVTATQAGDADAIAALMIDIASLEKRRNRVIRQQAQVMAKVSYQTSIPVRDRVIQTLHVGGRPLATRLLAEIAKARFNETIHTPGLASVRRDDWRSWRSAHNEPRRAAPRDVYIVSALTHDRYTPVRGSLALSTWPLDLRLIAPSSPRVDLLHVTAALATEVLSSQGAPYEASLRRLVSRLASTVHGLSSALLDDPAKVRDAVGSELARLTQLDDTERAEAAKRAEAQLTEEELLFGVGSSLAQSRAFARRSR